MIGKRLGLLAVLATILLLSACSARSGGETAAAPIAAVPTVALPPTVAPPAQSGAPSQAQSAPASAAPVGSINGRSYIAEVRVKDQVSLVPKVPGRLKELPVQVGDKVKAGDVIAIFDDSSQQAGLAQAQAQLGTAQAQLATAQAQLGAAQANLANLQAPARQVDIAQAQAAVKVAQAGLTRLQAGATDEDKEQARLRIDQAKNQLLGLQGQRDAACGQASALRDVTGPGKSAVQAQIAQASGSCDSLRGQTQAAEAAVQIAEQAYQRILNGATEYDVAQAQAAVEQAQAGVNRTTAGATAQQIAAVQAQVDVAQAQVNVAQAAVKTAEAGVNAAQLAVDETVIKAPFDGVITARNAAPGAIVGSGNTSVATLMSAANEVTFDVEAPLIGQVEMGAPVEITVDTYPGTIFKGKVVRVAPTADTMTRTFRVTAAPNDAKGQLKPGMFANLVIGGK